MALTKCKECGNEISSKAKACPNCGAVVKKTGCLTWFIAFFFLFFIFSAIIGSMVGDNKTPTTRTNSNVANTARVTYYVHKDSINVRKDRNTDSAIVTSLKRGDSVQVENISGGWGEAYIAGQKVGFVYLSLLEKTPIPHFEIVSWNWHKDASFGTDGSVIWNVEVRNNTNQYVNSLRVEFTTYDNAGQLMDTGYSYVKGLSPGGTAATKGYATYYGREAKAGIRIIE